MIEACDEAGIKLFVVKQNRFNVPVVKLREALEAGRFGKLVLGTVRVRWCRRQSYYDQDAWRGTWAQDGGILTNQASHHVDLLEWMMGDVVKVSAMSATATGGHRGGGHRGRYPEIRQRSARHHRGDRRQHGRRTSKDRCRFSVNGGSVVIGGFAVNKLEIWNFVEPREGDEAVKEHYSVNPPNVYGFGHQAYYEQCRRRHPDQQPPSWSMA